MIPKTVHYCWFGGNPLPNEYKEYISSWKKYLPGYKIICHDESNFDFDCDYVREAYACKKWAFVSDYARIKIIYEQGGIYLDTDIELIRELSSLVSAGPFMAIEKKADEVGVNLGLGFAAKKGDPLLLTLIDHYKNAHFINPDGSFDMTTVVTRVSDILCDHGFERKDKFQKISGFNIYPSEFFCPIDCATGKKQITDKTYSVHHYSASWISGRQRFKNSVKKLLGHRISYALIRLKKRFK